MTWYNIWDLGIIYGTNLISLSYKRGTGFLREGQNNLKNIATSTLSSPASGTLSSLAALLSPAGSGSPRARRPAPREYCATSASSVGGMGPGFDKYITRLSNQISMTSNGGLQTNRFFRANSFFITFLYKYYRDNIGIARQVSDLIGVLNHALTRQDPKRGRCCVALYLIISSKFDLNAGLVPM